jgi:hypothetical protein
VRDVSALLHPHSGPLTILGDEYDAGGFKGTTDNIQGGVAWFGAAVLKLPDSDNADARRISELLLRPV